MANISGNFEASNKALFEAAFSATDAETGDDINFTGAAIVIAIKDQSDYCAPKFVFTLGSGVTLTSSTVIDLKITAAQMRTLCPGTYRIGGTYEINDDEIQFLLGDFVVVDGVVP